VRVGVHLQAQELNVVEDQGGGRLEEGNLHVFVLGW
jgi:hypothetical protein